MKNPSNEAIDYFYKRTDKHISLVRKNLFLWAREKPELASELLNRASIHDESKYKEPERTPYIWRTWAGNCTLCNLPFEYPEGMDQQVRDAIFHHITHNRHHPEWHPDPDEMTEVDLIEMVCDWKAMSQEFGEKTPMNFANKVLGRRFKFSENKCDKIRELIMKTDNMADKKEDILENINNTRKMFIEIQNPTGFEVVCDAVLEMCFEEIEKLKCRDLS